MPPGMLLESGFLEKLGGSDQALGGLSHLDYFARTGGIAKGTQETSVAQVAQPSPRKPVHLQLLPRPAQ
eukprot:9162589-Pyramimonas_sp.AAC.2